MIGMIRRYLKGRARIIAKRQLAQGAKKVAQSVKDRNSKKKDATKGIKMIVSRVQARVLAVIVSIGIIVAPPSTFATTGIVHDPQSFAQSYAQFVESIEKYNNMIKTAQDSLDTMNRINDVMNMANNMLDNLQTGIANPKQLADRFQQNLDNIQRNAERIGKSLENRDWLNTFVKEEYASCKKKWQNLLKNYEKRKQQEEMSEIKSSTDKCIENGGSKEECQKSTEFTKAEFNEQQKEIEAGMNILEQGYNSGWTNMNNVIHGAFNEVQNKMNYANIENQLRGIKNPYNYQANICNMVEMERLKFDLEKKKRCYIEQTKAGNKKEAEKCLKEAKEKDRQIQENRNKRKKEIWKKANAQFNPANDENTTLDINDSTGELLPKEIKDEIGNKIDTLKYWNSKIKENWTENQIKESMKITVTKTDSNGKKTQNKEERYVARPQVIQKLIQEGYYNEALILQNKRNMLVAMQGDNQALAKSQLETFTMLGYQMERLNATVAELGNIQNEILQLAIDEEQDDLNFQKEEIDVKLEKFKYPNYDESDRQWQYNQYGGVELKLKSKKDNSGIGSLD